MPELTASVNRMVLSTLADEMSDSVVVVTREDRVVRYANPAARAFFDVKHDALVGTVFEYPIEDRTELSVACEPTPRIGEVRAKDIVWQGLAARVLTIRDITALVQQRVFERRLAKEQKRSANGQLVSGIAQEINNPATYLMTNLAIMRDIVSEFEAMCADPQVPRGLRERFHVTQSIQDLREMLDDNSTGLERIRIFLRELRNATAESLDHIAMVDINEVARTACAIIRDSREGVFELRDQLADVPKIAGDSVKLTQLLVNLIDNAIGALKGARRGDNTVLVSTRAQGQALYIAVRDSGRGIAPEHQHRIFDPLGMAGQSGVGVGLGLAVAAEIADAHRGHITVESELGRGSVFQVILPLLTDLSSCQETRHVLPGQVRARVLWLPSDQGTAKQVHEVLDDLHDVIDVDSGQQALDMLAQDRDYDVILIDVSANANNAVALHKALSKDAPELAARMVLIAPIDVPTAVQRLIDQHHLLVLDIPLSGSTLCDVVERMGP